MTIDAMTERLTENTYANAVWKVTTMATGLLVSIVVLRYMLAATQEWTNLFTARMQMAFTLGFHIILACLGVGLLATVGLVFIAIETPPLWEGFRLRAGGKEIGRPGQRANDSARSGPRRLARPTSALENYCRRFGRGYHHRLCRRGWWLPHRACTRPFRGLADACRGGNKFAHHHAQIV